MALCHWASGTGRLPAWRARQTQKRPCEPGVVDARSYAQTSLSGCDFRAIPWSAVWSRGFKPDACALHCSFALLSLHRRAVNNTSLCVSFWSSGTCQRSLEKSACAGARVMLHD